MKITLSVLDVFALRLQQYATTFDSINANLDRVAGHDDDYSPSIHTPSRRQSLEALGSLTGIIHGYCLAIDDVRDTDHGHTKSRFYRVVSAGLHRVEYEPVDHDAGHQSMGSLDAEAAAVARVRYALLGV